MPIIVLSVLIQVALVIHIVKTGRNTTWIWIVVTLPLAGSIAYLVIEVLPDLLRSRAGRRAGKTLESAINPNQHLNNAANQYAQSDTVENSMQLADECFQKGLYSDAKALYSKCLTGAHTDDPHLMVGLAKTDFALGHFPDVKLTLERLIDVNPDYNNADAHLLYARSLEKLHEIAAALHEYEVLHHYFSGPEASFYFARCLKTQYQHERANEIFNDIISTAKTSGKHYNSIHKDIIQGAKHEVSSP